MVQAIKTSPTFDPVARLWQYGLTTKQARYISHLSRLIGRDPDDVSWEVFDCPVKSLSRTAAKKLIKYLLSYDKSPS
jgi:hypothetical protein